MHREDISEGISTQIRSQTEVISVDISAQLDSRGNRGLQPEIRDHVPSVHVEVQRYYGYGISGRGQVEDYRQARRRNSVTRSRHR